MQKQLHLLTACLELCLLQIRAVAQAAVPGCEAAVQQAFQVTDLQPVDRASRLPFCSQALPGLLQDLQQQEFGEGRPFDLYHLAALGHELHDRLAASCRSLLPPRSDLHVTLRHLVRTFEQLAVLCC